MTPPQERISPWLVGRPQSGQEDIESFLRHLPQLLSQDRNQPDRDLYRAILEMWSSHATISDTPAADEVRRRRKFWSVPHVGEEDEMTRGAPPSREEVDAKLETQSAKMEAALARIDGRLDRMADRIEIGIESSQRAEQAARTIKWNILATAVGVTAVVVAVLMFWMQGMELIVSLL